VQVSPSDAQNVADLRLAARGDAEAQLRMARACRQSVLSGQADDIIASVEGLGFARLAAAQGVPDAIMLIAEHCIHLAQVYVECDEEPTAEMWAGQAIAVLELAAELLPASNAADLMQTLNTAADLTTANVMAEAKMFRAIFSPAFGAEAFA
jgi:hypothetical protein